MIAKTTSAPSFYPLAAYLSAGTDGRHPERVAWSTSRHLATDDLAVAPAIMEATAFQNAHVERPCYHVVVAFDAGDDPTRAQMEHVADQVLDRLGLADHQAVLVAHNDRDYAHVHIMVNRVHPETGVAWDRWRDRHLIEAALRDAEHALGMREVPGRLAPSHDRERPVPLAREAGLTWGERRQAARTGELPLLDRARAALMDCRAATSWTALDAALAERGLAIERTTRGLTVTDGRQNVSASRVAPDLGLPRLERRFGERFPEREAAPDIERLAGAIRALSHDADLERAGREATATRQLLTAQLTATQMAAQRARGLSQQFTQDLAQVYVDPLAARRAFDAIERQLGIDHACAMLANRPEELGVLRTLDTPRALGLVAKRDNRPAREAAHWISHSAREMVAARDASGGAAAEAGARHVHEAAVAASVTARHALAEHRTRHPDREEMRQDVGLTMLRLNPEEARALQRLLTTTELALARAIAHEVREIYQPRERGRGQAFIIE